MNECSALTALTSTGAEVPVEVGLGPVTVGGVPMVLTSIRDISSRVAANARLLEAERRSAESQKLEAIGRLAGGVAHDFNNLMTVVIVSAESLLAETRDSEAKEVLREIVLAGQRAAELTEQLLTFARNQRGQPERVVLNDRLRSFSRLLTRLVGERVSLRFEFGEGVAPIVLTPPNVDQVVLNLVLNSRDAMPHGGNIVVRTLTEAVAGRHWSLIEVQDDGLGIDDGIRQHIFEPFFTTKPVGRGSGLGLATVYGIVKQAGGDITVTSARGRGSTFRVRFPADG
jgi:signal transduction histidine kinase